MRARIALLGQPNTGKTTLFNGLTGNHHHTGNWAGKTVSMERAICNCGDRSYEIVDLPGAYGLTALSPEEKIGEDFLDGGHLDGVLVLLDASQLSRSLYLLANLVGIRLPVMVVVTMVDVLRRQKKTVDFEKFSRLLGVPVIAANATKREDCRRIATQLEFFLRDKKRLCGKGLLESYEALFSEKIGGMVSIFGKKNLGCYDVRWWAVKLLEDGKSTLQSLEKYVSKEKMERIFPLIHGENFTALSIAGARYQWIGRLLEEIAGKDKTAGRQMAPFDRWATHPFWGMVISIVILAAGFSLSLILAERMQNFFHGWTVRVFTHIGGSKLASFFSGAILPGLEIGFYLLVFVGSLSFFINLLESLGYMARIAYIFDGLLVPLGLQGRCVLPLLAGFGCTIAAVSGSRIIDSKRQRLLTLALSWVIPCAGTWGVVGFIAALFFGVRASWVIGGLFGLLMVHVMLTATLFGVLPGKDRNRMGFLMELPLYHRPNWRILFRDVAAKMGELLRTSLPIIILTTAILWLLAGGCSITGPLFRIIDFLEPMETILGIPGRLFIVLLLSLINREASLGALAALFCVAGENFPAAADALGGEAGRNLLGGTLRSTVTLPQALAFLAAYFFNVPCCAAIAATAVESKSWRWTLALMAYYSAMALLFAAVVFHISRFFFHAA